MRLMTVEMGDQSDEDEDYSYNDSDDAVCGDVSGVPGVEVCFGAEEAEKGNA
jgi:hypothetical protein